MTLPLFVEWAVVAPSWARQGAATAHSTGGGVAA